ncbi:MAG: 2OG-Fe(II) oxygenase [Rhizobacter sp.]|nr:2OG-Fe(II) oxygenase [Rhizobacter sp.]
MTEALHAGPSQRVLSTDEIPVIDLGPYLAFQAGALDVAAQALLRASTEVGFYYLANHGVAQALIDDVFAQSARFHALPEADKLRLKVDKNKIGYFGEESTITRHSALGHGTRPNLYSALCIREDLAADDPDVLAGKLFRGVNQWPEALPGFRGKVVAYYLAVKGLAFSMLPLFSRALDLPLDHFDAAFRKPLVNMQLNHYEHQPSFDGSQYGLAPHTDRTFITILCQSRVPGLEIRTVDQRWVTAPVLPGHLLVNTGDLLRFWSNERFLSTPHRVINTAHVERHSVPFFYAPDPDTMIECLPTCCSPDNPARNPPIRYTEFYEWFVRQNYPDVVSALAAASA